MRAERFGSYSMVATVPGTPYLSRLKSISRSCFLCPPPWWRMLSIPVELRPPVRCLGANSGLCGLLVVRSSFTSFVWKRSVGVIGRKLLIGISLSLPAAPRVAEARYMVLAACGLSYQPASVPWALRPGPSLDLRREVRHLFAGLQTHIRLLPIRLVAGELAPAALLAFHTGRPDGRN